MTLVDLGRLIRRYWAIVVLVPIICGLACFAYLSLPQEQTYSATARIVGNSCSDGVLGIATSEGRQLTDAMKAAEGSADDSPVIKVEAKVDIGTQTVAVTASGPNGDDCIRVANQIAENAEAAAERAYAGSETPYEGYVEKALLAEESVAKAKLKYLVVALLAGLFVAICIVICMDIAKRPVKSIGGVQDAVGLPVLEKLPANDGGERLLANVRFASKRDDVQTVCVVPVNDSALSADVCDLLVGAALGEGVDARIAKVDRSFELADAQTGEGGRTSFVAIPCESFSKGMAGAYVAREADAVVIAVRQWSDSIPMLQSAVAELQLAQANLVGMVFAPEKRGKR